MRFCSLRAIRAMVLGLCVFTSTPMAAAWAASAPPAECHECCPDGLQPAAAENCCIAAPAGPGAPESARPVAAVNGPPSVVLLSVARWALPAPLAPPARTAPPPLPPSAVLLRTSVLLI